MNKVIKNISTSMSFGGLFGCILGLTIAFGIISIAPHLLNSSGFNQFYGACIFFGVFGGMALGALAWFFINFVYSVLF